MQQLEHKHPRPVRWMHWLNVVLLSGMIWSGLLIYWANDVYGLRIGGRELFHFFPTSFYQALGLNHRLAEGMAWHFTLMWGFALNGLVYVGYTLTLHGAWNHEIGQPLAKDAVVQVRKAGAITYPTWEFNNVPVGRAMDPVNKLHLWSSADGVTTYPSIWTHGADARTFFPVKDEPVQGCVP